MKILYVSHSNRSGYLYQDPSVRYRCYNFAEELVRAGNKADVCHFEKFEDDFIDRYDVFVFHKPKFSSSLVKLLEKLKTNTKLAIADFDDLVFDERYAEESSLFLSARGSLKNVIRLHREYHKALRLFVNVTVSTTPLKTIVQKTHPGANVRVIHNGLSSRWVRQGRYMYQKNYEDKMIGYFPGTSTHHYDYKIVEPALVRFLEKHKDIRLLILGPLKIDEKEYDSQQLLLFPAVSYEQLPYWIKQCWITIAPLQQSLFNHCKSGLKFFESAIWGVPLIATAIPDLIRCDTELHFAEDERGWLDQFEMMLADAPYTKISKKIENWTIEHCMAQNQLPQWLEFVNQRRYREN